MIQLIDATMSIPLSGEMSKDFASLPEARVILPKSPVEIGGPMWKRHTPSYYLAELIAALRGAGMLEGKLGAGPPPDWFPSDNWSWRTFKNSSSGPIKRKTDICESILRFWGFEPSKHNLATDGGREGGVEHEGVTVEVVAREEGLLNSLEGTIIDAVLQFIYNLFIIFVT